MVRDEPWPSPTCVRLQQLCAEIFSKALAEEARLIDHPRFADGVRLFGRSQVLRLFFALSILVPIPAIANSIPFPNLPDPTPACRIVFGTPNLLPYYNKCINDEQTSHDLLKGVWNRLPQNAVEACTKAISSWTGPVIRVEWERLAECILPNWDPSTGPAPAFRD